MKQVKAVYSESKQEQSEEKIKVTVEDQPYELRHDIIVYPYFRSNTKIMKIKVLLISFTVLIYK